MFELFFLTACIAFCAALYQGKGPVTQTQQTGTTSTSKPAEQPKKQPEQTSSPNRNRYVPVIPFTCVACHRPTVGMPPLCEKCKRF